MVTFKDRIDFRPHYTPRQMFMKGIFQDVGGYFRPIHSGITNKNYTDDYKEFKFLNNVPTEKLSRENIDISKNHYKVKCGTSLEFWESKHWIKPEDPRGYVQWYCRYYNGRRGDDDERQISRYKNILARFGKRKNKSNVIKQVLLQWGIDWEKLNKNNEYYT